jgi:hypothetical protein
MSRDSVADFPAYADKHARTYGSPPHERVNVWEVWKRFRIHPGVFNKHQRKGWPSLRGRKLTAYPEPTPHGRQEATFLTADLVVALDRPVFPFRVAGGTWLDERIWRDDHGLLWLTLAGVLLLYPDLADGSVKRYGKNPCRFLKDERGKRRKIQTNLVDPAGARAVDQVRVYLKDDIETIAERMSKDQPDVSIKINNQKRWVRKAIHVDKDGRGCLTEVQIMENYGVGRGFFAWENKPSRQRPGEMALRSYTIPNAVKQKGSPGEIKVYVEDDVKDILAGKESKHPGVGKGQNAKRLRDENLSRAKKAVETVLRERDGLRMGSLLRRVKELARVGQRVARQAIAIVTIERREAQNKRFRRLNPAYATSSSNKNGHTSASDANPKPTSNGNGHGAVPDTKKHKRGRRPGSIDLGRLKRIEQMLAAWDERRYGDNKARTGRMFQFGRFQATNLINEHDRKKRCN